MMQSKRGRREEWSEANGVERKGTQRKKLEEGGEDDEEEHDN